MALLALALALAAGAARAEDNPRCPAEIREDRIASAQPGGDIVLASGLRVRLADIRVAEAGSVHGEQRRRAAAWLDSLRDDPVRVAALGPPDRWNVRPAQLALDPGGPNPIDIAELLVSEGLALVDPGERYALCRPELLAVEGRARSARRGLWAAGRLPLSAHDPEALAAAIGEFAVIEGRIVSVGERSARTYLNFGRNFARDFAASIPRRQWAAMKRAGLEAASLRGRMVRVRGHLEMRRAPALEILVADALEWKDPIP